MFLSKYGVARHLYIPVVKRAVIDFAVGADWTPAAGDVKISKNGGAAANVTNLPTAITMGNTAMWDLSLTATELQAAQVMVTVADAAAKAVEDQMLVIETYGNAAAQHEFDLDTPTVNPGTGGIVAASFAAGAIDASAIATDAIGSAELASTSVTEIVDAVWATAMTELTTVPGVTGTTLAALTWLFELARNKRTQSATVETLFKDDGATTLATSAKSDVGGLFTRAEYT